MAEDDAQNPEEADLPPPIPDPEMSAEDLAALVDAGNVAAVADALHEQTVRLPAVLRELSRVLDEGLGNLGAAIATMLIGEFRVAQANALADRVLAQSETAGVDELVDLVAALMQQERLASATKVLAIARAKDEKHDRARYFSARLAARRGRLDDAFDLISRVRPKVLGPDGLLVQARYAALIRRDKALKGALKGAKKAKPRDKEAFEHAVRAIELVQRRMTTHPEGQAFDLRTAFAVEYGAILVEHAQNTGDEGRFDAEPLSYGDAGALIRKIGRVVGQITPEPFRFLYATEDGEVVAAGLAKMFGKDYQPWRRDRSAFDGDWLCMGSAATHPHLPNAVVATLDTALSQGVLRSLALVLPVGWRAPLVPDIVGRMTRDDEFPWAVDDEIDDIYAEVVDEEASNLAAEDGDALEHVLAQYGDALRARTGHPHQPFTDEMPVLSDYR